MTPEESENLQEIVEEIQTLQEALDGLMKPWRVFIDWIVSHLPLWLLYKLAEDHRHDCRCK